MKKQRREEIGILIIFMAAATLVGTIFRWMRFPETNIVIVYLLAVVFIARFTKGFIFGILGSIIATFCFNYFFTSPYLTFSVDNPTYIITFVIMTITTFIISALTSREILHAAKAKEKEAETKTLYTLTNQLSDAKRIEDIVEVAIENISGYIDGKVGCLLFDENGVPENTYIYQKENGEFIHRETKNIEELKTRFMNLRMEYIEEEEFYDWPIYGQESILGIIRIPKEKKIENSHLNVLHSMIENIGIAMDRLYFVNKEIKNQEMVTQERYRSNLLRAISHDLRTPLAGIIGTSEMLMDMTPKEDKRYEWINGIYKDADWLHCLVENILNLTRIQDEKMIVYKEEEAVEEVIDATLQRLYKRAPEYDIQVEIPEEFFLIPMDAKLIGQVLLNLLDNAIKHTKASDEIKIKVEKDEENQEAVFMVIDHGEGILEEDLPNIFQIFYTSAKKHADAKNGIGIGLAICETVIKAHGGRIEAKNLEQGHGAEFIFRLPLK